VSKGHAYPAGDTALAKGGGKAMGGEGIQKTKSRFFLMKRKPERFTVGGVEAVMQGKRGPWMI